MISGIGTKMFPITDAFQEDKSGSKWEQFDVSWREAATYLVKSGNPGGIQDPPPVISRAVSEGETLHPADLVYVFRFNHRYHIIGAESEQLKSNSSNGDALLIGNKMLRKMAEELVAALSE